MLFNILQIYRLDIIRNVCVRHVMGINTPGSMDSSLIANINDNPSKLDKGKKCNSLPNIFVAQYIDFNCKPVDKAMNDDSFLPNNKLNIDECNIMLTSKNTVKCSITTTKNLLPSTDMKTISAAYSNASPSYQNDIVSAKEINVRKYNLENIDHGISTSPNEGCISGRLEICVIPTG